MKALVYDPYLDTMGGGERYILTFSQALKEMGYTVTLAWPDRRTLQWASERFGLFPDYNCDALAFGAFFQNSFWQKWQITRQYDLVLFVSDGSIPYLFGRKNFIHFQTPFTKLGGNQINNLFKMLRVNRLIFNSNFTANIIKKQLPLASFAIIYPPIDTESFKPGKKENIILSVARFDSPSHAKRQDILIEAFKKLHQQKKDYQLILAGAIKGEGGEDYLSLLRQTAKGLPVEFVPNPDFNELKKLYAQAKIFWHAAGYGIDENVEPEKVEHFGITTVEAMAAGCVPVVIDRGGQREIIIPRTGYLCGSVDEIVASTLSLINSAEKLKSTSKNAIKRSRDFNTERFIREVNATI